MSVNTYQLLAEHPNGRTRLDVELIATSERAAISRTRGTLLHRDHDVRWMDGTFTVTHTDRGVWPRREDGTTKGKL